MNNLRLKLRARILLRRWRRWFSPPASTRPMMGELVTFRQRQFSALSNSLRLAIWYNKRANPDYRTRTYFRVWSRPAQGELNGRVE